MWAAAAVAAVVAVLLLFARSRGALVRIAALALLVLALANPSLTREDRDPLTSVAVVVVDKSPSQSFGDRTAQTEAARAAVAQRLQRIPGIEMRVVEAGQADGETDGTRLFSRAQRDARRRAARSRRRRDLHHRRPRPRRAGRCRRARLRGAGPCPRSPAPPTSATAASCWSRRRASASSARSQTISFKVEDEGVRAVARRGEDQPRRRAARPAHRRARPAGQHPGPDPACRAEHRRDRGGADRGRADAGQQSRRGVDRRRARQAARAAGVRRAPCGRAHLAQPPQVRCQCRPRPLHHPAAAGEAGRHADQRAVADRIPDPRAVHTAPKLNDFQLIIFDRYARQGVLPIIYFDNIAKYVRNGGAVLVAAGPDYAGPDQHLAHAARLHPAGRADRARHRGRRSTPASPIPGSAIR